MQDEAIVSLLTSVVCGWSRVGHQLRIPSSGKHDRCCVFGVVNPLTGDVHYRIFDRINRTNMKRFIRHLHRFYGKSQLPVFRSWIIIRLTKGRFRNCWKKQGFTPFIWPPIRATSMGLKISGNGYGNAIFTTPSSRSFLKSNKPSGSFSAILRGLKNR